MLLLVAMTKRYVNKEEGKRKERRRKKREREKGRRERKRERWRERERERKKERDSPQEGGPLSPCMARLVAGTQGRSIDDEWLVPQLGYYHQRCYTPIEGRHREP